MPLIDNILPGKWRLKINGTSANEISIDSEEIDIEVTDNETLHVYVSLYPANEKKLSVKIKYKTDAAVWNDYSGNPIFTASMSPTNPLGVIQAKVIYDDNKYKMWYTNLYNSAAADVGYAESPDGKNWTNASPTAVLKPSPGEWDSHAVIVGGIIKVNSIYRMYYTGYSSEFGSWHIGLATSTDGINWIKQGSPVLLAGEDFQIPISDVIVCNQSQKYLMYYSIRKPGYRAIGVAFSYDGINWTKYSGNPILVSSSPWENGGVYFPTVLIENNKYKMAFMDFNATGFGFAKSFNGGTWTKEDSNPFFTKSDTYNNWSCDVAYPYLRKFNNQYHIYYTGTYNGENAIGLLTK